MATTLEGPQTIEALLEETRRFPPPESFRARALVNDPAVYETAQRDPEAFWGGQARELLDWYQPFGRVLDWDPPHAKWFLGGTLNAAYNCVDRHIATWRRSKAAIVFEGEPGDERVLTYQDLYREVNRAAIALRYLGVGKGDRVAIYLPMVPELAIAMLACARLGAPHTVVFGGFSSEALRDRINDCGAKLLITADGGWRRGNVVPLKLNADRAVAGAPTIEHVVVVRRIGEREPVVMRDGLDLWWDELLDEAERATGEKIVPPEPVDSEHPLFILYTSGTTGKPKGVLHTTAGYLVGTSLTHKWIFDLKEDDVYWCTADVGWVTGHSYIVYGPLCNGATTVMYEGAPDYPDKDRFWAIVEKHRATILYTAPTAIRAFMRWGDEYPQRHDMSSLRLLGTVGEPINPEAWMWYRQVIGGDRCPIVDTWWQTETGAIMISPLPGLTTTKPGSATFAFPGVGIDVVDENGSSVKTGGGFLVLTQPWPAMLRTLWGDDARYVETYWRRFPGKYYTGDGCKRDEDGYIWLLGRVDDVLNVAGHRLSTMEIESALVSHPAVAEAAVIGVTDELTGQAVAAFATLRSGIQPTEQLRRELREHVSVKIGPIARPRQVFFTGELPKTRSGKIMRRLLRDIAEGRVLGDTTTLLDAAVLGPIQKEYEKTEV